MKKLLLPVVVVCGVLCTAVSSAFSEVRTPLPLYYSPYMFYPVQYHWDKQDDGCCWNAKVWGMGYYRSAACAFSNCHGRNKVAWPYLIFNQEDFTLEQSFTDSYMDLALPENPFVAISRFHPRYEYREAGAMFFGEVGGTFDWCDCSYRFGLRGRLPYRDIEVANVCNYKLYDTTSIGDVWQVADENTENTPSSTVRVFAGRLDFLSHLLRIRQPAQLLVNYRDTTQTPTQITMAQQLVGAAVDGTNGLPCVAAISSPTQVFPSGYWGRRVATIDGTVDGSGVVSGTRNRFVAATDYTNLQNSTLAQSTLFIVPSLTDADVLSSGASTIRDAVQASINDIRGSVESFLTETGLNFCDGRTQGVGDFDLELFLGRNWLCEGALWTDFTFAVRFPTAKKLNSCLCLMKLPAGNNGHYELRVGLAGGYDICNWVKFMLDGAWSWVLHHRECVAAPFQGATVKNIGPCINADTKWGYFVGHADFSFFTNDCCGFDVGYEGYYKRCDCIKLCQTTATDFVGRTDQPLDVTILRNNSERAAHKIRVGFFTLLGDCSVSAGWSQTVAGKNISRDTDWYLKMDVSF